MLDYLVSHVVGHILDFLSFSIIILNKSLVTSSVIQFHDLLWTSNKEFCLFNHEDFTSLTRITTICMQFLSHRILRTTVTLQAFGSQSWVLDQTN